jgi:hypothetical protein
MDTHSNILYVKENFPALSHLAHRTAATDKYRPETCCIIGNYYSLKAQHEKVSCSFLTTLGHSLLSLPDLKCCTMLCCVTSSLALPKLAMLGEL